MEVNVFNTTGGSGTKKRQLEVLVTVVEESEAEPGKAVLEACIYQICFSK